MHRTSADLRHRHPLHEKYLPTWQFHLAAWEGTQALVEHGCLERHERESLANYQRRRERAVSFNYSKSIVDLHLQYLFEHHGRRELGTLADDPRCQRFLHDADLFGTTYDRFWYEAQQYASICGHVGILITKQPSAATSLADEAAAGIHPYYALYLPPAILDWRHERAGGGRPRLTYLKLLDGDGTLRIWTPTTWEVWSTGAAEGYRLTASGTNPLGEVPFVWHLNSPGRERFIGVSDIHDVARLDVSIMRNLSQADEVIDLAAFPMLMMPEEVASEPASETPVGPSAVLGFDPDRPDAKPDWLRAEVLEPIDAILRFVGCKVNEIYRMTNTQGVVDLADRQVPSGRALQLMFRQLNAKLAARAANLEASELACLAWWCRWQGLAIERIAPRLERPREFSVVELADDIDQLLRAADLVPSAAFRQAVQRGISRRVLPDLDDERQRRIDAEIDAAHAPDNASNR